ncbi:MAG TPA: nucleotidyl transferase AbiEii/AbiGii toxin family protein, partial [Spirochaetia bacterium]|nr:nucleotidyl transferase AbiEii/AbiGii toxin family protein [Spirochaetia bacterium]
IQIDVGFGNAIVPGPEETEYRTILGDPAPRILAYPRESVVSEKLHAMVTLGERNSRYKDFYDLYAMAGAFTFERSTLVRAVRATFDRRVTPVHAALPVALGAAFYSDPARAAQWRAYVGRNELTDAPADFIQIGERLAAFLGPVWSDVRANNASGGDWPAGGPWR